MWKTFFSSGSTRLTAGAAFTLLCLSVVGQFEGRSLVAYRDIVGKPTACYGETRGIRMGMSFTKSECDEMLLKGLRDFEAGVYACAPTLQRARDEQVVAHISLAYNIGTGAYCRSSVAKRVNAGDPKGACHAIMAFNKATYGKPQPGQKCSERPDGRFLCEVRGLTLRRTAERDLCLKGV